MEIASLTVPAARLSRLEEPWEGPLAIVELDAACDAEVDLRLPPCPVIGLGSRTHPLAARVDVLMEPPFALAALVRNVMASRRAAATLVHVLRSIQAVPPVEALAIESMAYAMLQGSAEHAAWKSARKPSSVSPPGSIRLARNKGVLEIVLDRPEAGNAIDRPMRDALSEALGLAALDPDLRCVRLMGKGRTFSLGSDLDEFGTTRDPATAHVIRSLTLPAHAAIACADRLEAYVDGACVGAGLELAAFASRITATPRSWFQLPELAMGIIPGAGGCVSVSRRIGRQRTALLVLSGRRIAARQALEWGLVDALVDDLAGDDGSHDTV